MPVSLTIDGTSVTASAAESVFDCAQRVGVHVPTSCSGQGKCRECLVEVEQGMQLLTPRGPEEAHLEDAFRLSCRARIQMEEGNIRCATLKRGKLRIEESGMQGASSQAAIDPPIVRRAEGVVRDGEILETECSSILGLAIDVGTTTVVLRLHDLESGRAIATRSFENPQRFGGSDVMARIRYDSERSGRLLQRTLLGYLSHAIESLPCDPLQIFEVVVAGNTTMRDLFFGLDVSSVGEFPYHSTTETARRTGELKSTTLLSSARKLRLPIHPRARIHGLPLIGGHIGADTAAALLATCVGSGAGVEVLMDIGTNTEVVVGHAGRLLAASCPAGPAFEGGRIEFGMPGFDGAIEQVALPEQGPPLLEVIGDATPQGVCGSGLVSALGELRRTERMNSRGRFENGESSFVLDSERGITVSELDINELAQAKGANAAGLRAVLDVFGPEAQAIERFHLAGGFARHLDLDAARRIGLIPDLPDEVFVRAGNVSLEGAALALTSRAKRDELEALVLRIEHVNLETHPDFFDFFVDGCQFEAFRP